MFGEAIPDVTTGCLLNGLEKFAGFSIVRLIGRGGMGEVYLMRNSAGEEFAVKVMRAPDDGKSREWRRRFAREAEFAMKIRHPNLIAVHDVGEDSASGLCYIVMDYAGGGSLADRIRESGPMKIRDAVALASQIAAALEVAHSAGVIHRDIKPDNVLFDSEGRVKLADLGIAKFSNSGAETTVTKTGMIIGTPAYMAPEQMMNSHSVDYRADVYSLGIVLYEMLTGVRPHADSTIVELMAKAVNGEELPDIRTVRPETSAALAYIIALMVSPKPEERPESAEAVAKLLADLAAGRIKVPKEYRHNRTLMERARKRRRKVLSVLAVVASAASLVAGLAWFARHLPKPPPEKVTVVETTVVTNMPREVRIEHAPEMMKKVKSLCQFRASQKGQDLVKGCFYFGKIQLDGRNDVHGVAANTYRISEDGTFAGVLCADASNKIVSSNIVFECQGYERMTVPVPESQGAWNGDLAVDLGTIAMARMVNPDERSLVVPLSLPEGVKSVNLKIRLRNMQDLGRWLIGYSGPKGVDVMTANVGDGECIVLKGCVPQSKYELSVSGGGCADYKSLIEYPESGTLELDKLQVLPVQEAIFATRDVGGSAEWVSRKILLCGAGDRLVLKDAATGGMTNEFSVGLNPYCGEADAVQMVSRRTEAICRDMGAMSLEAYLQMERAGRASLSSPTGCIEREFNGTIVHPGHVYVVALGKGPAAQMVAMAFLSLKTAAADAGAMRGRKAVPVSDAPEFLRDSIAKHMGMRLKLAGGARMVFGRIELDGQEGIGDTATTSFLNPDGTFTDFMDGNQKNIVFECHGYARVEIPVLRAEVPPGEKVAMDLGTIRMHKLNPTESIDMQFIPVLPVGDSVADVSIEMISKNAEYKGKRFSRDRARVLVLRQTVKSGQKVVLSGCSPSSKYGITIKADNCMTYTAEVELSQLGGIRDFGEIKPKEIKVAIMSLYDDNLQKWLRTSMLLKDEASVDLGGPSASLRRSNNQQVSRGRLTFSFLEEVNGRTFLLAKSNDRFPTILDIGRMSPAELQTMLKFSAKLEENELLAVFDKDGYMLGMRLEVGHAYKLKSSDAKQKDVHFIIEQIDSAASVDKASDKGMFSVPVGRFVWSYTVDNGKAILMGLGDGTDVRRPCATPDPNGKHSIPTKLAGYDVVGIGPSAFLGCSKVTSLELPKTLEWIGDNAFKDCSSLQSVRLPPNVKSVGRSAFSNCVNLKSVDLNNCTNLVQGNGVFLHSYRLERFSVSDTNEVFRSLEGALISVDGKTLVALPPGRRSPKLPMWMEAIGPFALCRARCSSLALPKTLKTLGEGAFMDCKYLQKLVFMGGDAPTTDEGEVPIFKGASSDMRIEVSRGSKGWNGPGSTDLPKAWPVGAGLDARPISYRQAVKAVSGGGEQ